MTKNIVREHISQERLSMTSMVESIISLNLLFSLHFLKRRLPIKFLRESTGNVLEKSNIEKQVTKNNLF